MAHSEIEPLLFEIVGRDLRMDARYPVTAPRSVESAAQLIRLARDHQYGVMVLGGGSSFPPDFSMLRENVIVIRTVYLNAVQKLSPFAVRVFCGANPATVVRSEAPTAHKTLGGLICDPRAGRDPVLRALWSRARRIEVIGASGDVQKYAGPAAASLDDPATANVFLGSRGRLGLVASVELATPVPFTAKTAMGDRPGAAVAGIGESPLSQKDIQTLADPHGVFQWS